MLYQFIHATKMQILLRFHALLLLSLMIYNLSGVKFNVLGILFLVISCTRSSKADHSFIETESLYARESLGRLLFFDTNLSANKTISCASCHQPNQAFADTVAFSSGVFGRKAFRNTPSIISVKNQRLFHADGGLPTLERQVLAPLLDRNELNASLKQVIQRLKKNPNYEFLAQKAYGRPIDAFVLTRSIAAFERTLIHGGSKFDIYNSGKKSVFTSEEKRGWELFKGKLNCITCHPAPHFTTLQFEHNGLSINAKADMGRSRITGQQSDVGKFKVPSLRNCGVTAPYMHDGRFKDLKSVINHYLSGGNNHENQSKKIKKHQLSKKEVQVLELFLQTLTDTVFKEKQGVY